MPIKGVILIFVIAVVIEQGYGGSYASLTAGRILDAYYADWAN